MDSTRFDSVSKTFADRRSRRSALKIAATGLGATVVGATIGRSALAQNATPAASPEAVTADPSFLFVQMAHSGTFIPDPNAGTPVAGSTPVAGGGADYLLTLEGHSGSTIYFSDRPERIFGDAPTQKFLDGLGFTPTNPPNAAIVTHAGDGTEDVLVVELRTPIYNDATSTLTYGVTVLSDYTGEGLAHVAIAQKDLERPASFGRTSLFIDSCQDNTMNCYDNTGQNLVGSVGTVSMCWDFGDWCCHPCSGTEDGWIDTCNAVFEEQCNNSCMAELSGGCW